MHFFYHNRILVTKAYLQVLKLTDELKELVAEGDWNRGSPIAVELVDSELSKVLSMSKNAEVVLNNLSLYSISRFIC